MFRASCKTQIQHSKYKDKITQFKRPVHQKHYKKRGEKTYEGVVELFQKFFTKLINNKLCVASKFLDTEGIQERGYIPEQKQVSVYNWFNIWSLHLFTTEVRLSVNPRGN